MRISASLASQRAQYFIDWVDGQVRQMVGQPTQDLVVQTTIDLPIQAAAERAVYNTIQTDGAPRGVQQAALVAMDGEGRIRAYVGGVDYADSQFDRASMAHRQAGSAFKPFVYLTAMEQGRRPEMIVNDEPIKIGDWEPHNYTNRYLGPITLQTALAEVDQHRRRATGQRDRHRLGGRHGAPAGHRLADPDQPVHGAGRGGGHAAGNDPGLRRLRQRRLQASCRAASSASAPPRARCSMTPTASRRPAWA